MPLRRSTRMSTPASAAAARALRVPLRRPTRMSVPASAAAARARRSSASTTGRPTGGGGRSSRQRMPLKWTTGAVNSGVGDHLYLRRCCSRSAELCEYHWAADRGRGTFLAPASAAEVDDGGGQFGCRRPPLPLLPASRCGPGGHRCDGGSGGAVRIVVA